MKEQQTHQYSRLPKHLMDIGIQLESLGLSEVGWRYPDIMEVLSFLLEKNLAILGGDVYVMKDESIKQSFDNWSLDQGELNWDEYLQKSHSFASRYIRDYLNRYSDIQDDLIFVPVFKGVTQ